MTPQTIKEQLFNYGFVIDELTARYILPKDADSYRFIVEQMAGDNMRACAGEWISGRFVRRE